MEELEFMISQFIDGELDEKEQGVLFKKLSLDPDARSLLQEYINLKTEVNRKINSHINMSDGYGEIKKEKKYKIAFYSSVAIILIMFVSVYSIGFNSFDSNLTNKGRINIEQVRDNSSIENTYLERVNKMRTVKITGEDVLSKKL